MPAAFTDIGSKTRTVILRRGTGRRFVRVGTEQDHRRSGHIAGGAEAAIRAEVSYKYDLPRLEAVTSAGGWRIDQLFTDEEDRFWVAWLRPAQA